MSITQIRMKHKFKYILAKTYAHTHLEQLSEHHYPQVRRSFLTPNTPGHFCLPTTFTTSETDAIRNIPYSFLARQFFGWPLPQDKGIKKAGKIAWAAASAVVRVPFNVLRFGTEVLPSLGVAAVDTLLDKIDDNFSNYSDKAKTGKLLKGLVYATLYPLTRLVHFTGQSITSPMRNARESWQMFGSWRNGFSKTKKTLGYILGATASLYSTASTAVTYFFLSPLLLAGAAKIGLTAFAATIGNGIQSLPVIGPLFDKVAMGFEVAKGTVSLGLLSAGNYLAPYFGPTVANFFAALATQPVALVAALGIPTVGNAIRPVTDKVIKPMGRKIVEGFHDFSDKLKSLFASKKETSEVVVKPVISSELQSNIVEANQGRNLSFINTNLREAANNSVMEVPQQTVTYNMANGPMSPSVLEESFGVPSNKKERQAQAEKKEKGQSLLQRLGFNRDKRNAENGETVVNLYQDKNQEEPSQTFTVSNS